MNNPWDEITPPSKDLSARRVDHTHPLDLFWARDHLGNYLFVYEFEKIDIKLPTALPALAGIQSMFLKAENTKYKNRFVLLLKERVRWEIFLSLCNDLLQVTRHAKSPSLAIQTLLRRLSHWQEFLKKIRPTILPEETIKGLIGELLFIKKHLIPVFGVVPAIKFWQGPEGLPQDFNVNDSAIEVKCQSGATAPNVRITSEEQLCPQLPEMYLYVVTLGKTTVDNEEVMNLPSLIGDLRKELEFEETDIIERFNDLLHMIGYIDSDLYSDYCYILTGQKIFQVNDNFPRICNENIPLGVNRLSYHIDLFACEPFEKHPAWMKV